MNLIIPTLVYVAARQSLPLLPKGSENGSAAASDDNLPRAEARTLPAFRDSSIDYLPELSFEQIEDFYGMVKNRVNELNFSKLRLWLVYENIFSHYQPPLDEDLLELRERIKDYLNIPVMEINVLALVRNRIRLGDPLQNALQKAAQGKLIDYVLLLNNSNLGWKKPGNILQLSEDEFCSYGLRMIEYIHFANIMLDDLAFSFNSLTKRRFYFTISSSFNDFSFTDNNQNKAQDSEIYRFFDAVRGCLQVFFADSLRELQRRNQTDIFGFLENERARNEARQIIFQALQSESKTRDDLLNTLYKKFLPNYFKKLEQIFTLLIVLTIFQTGLLDQFERIKEYIAASTDLDKAKRILPLVIGGKVINKINDARDEKLHNLRLDRETLEERAWKSETENLWKSQFSKKIHPGLRKIFEKNLEIIRNPEKSSLNNVADEDFLKQSPIEYKESKNALGSKAPDLILALRHILKMVLKNAFENSYTTVQENFLLLNKNRIRNAQFVSDLNDAYVICKQMERFKDFLSVEEIDKSKFLKESRDKFKSLVNDYLNQAEMSDYAPEIMARDVGELLYSALNNCKKNQPLVSRSVLDKKIEELPVFFTASSILSDYASPVLSVVFTREKMASFKDQLWLIQNIDHQDQKFSLFGPWDEQICFE